MITIPRRYSKVLKSGLNKTLMSFERMSGMCLPNTKSTSHRSKAILLEKVDGNRQTNRQTGKQTDKTKTIYPDHSK